MERMKKVLIGCSVVACALVMAQTASAFVIDSFTAPQSVVPVKQNGLGHALDESDTFASIMGGQRDVDIEETRGSGEIAVRQQLAGTASILEYNESSTAGGRMWITWDGNDNAPGFGAVATGGLGTEDFAVGGATELRLGVYSGLGGTATITLWNNGNPYSVSHVIAMGNPAYQQVSFAYADFTGLGAGISSIGAVQLGWVANPLFTGSTANFDYLGSDEYTPPEEVPEPGTMALMAALMGMGGFSALRKRLFGVKQPAVA